MSIPITIHVDGFNSARDRQEAVTQTPTVITDSNGIFSIQPFSFTPPANEASTKELRTYLDRGYQGDNLLSDMEINQFAKLRANITGRLDRQIQTWF